MTNTLTRRGFLKGLAGLAAISIGTCYTPLTHSQEYTQSPTSHASLAHSQEQSQKSQYSFDSFRSLPSVKRRLSTMKQDEIEKLAQNWEKIEPKYKQMIFDVYSNPQEFHDKLPETDRKRFDNLWRGRDVFSEKYPEVVERFNKRHYEGKLPWKVNYQEVDFPDRLILFPYQDTAKGNSLYTLYEFLNPKK